MPQSPASLQPGDEVVTEPPSTKVTNKKATFSGLDKITGRIINFDEDIGETVQFGALRVKTSVCYTRPSTEAANTDAFVEVDEITLQGEVKRIFSGWMYAASPGLHGVEHPVYDIWLTDCKGPDQTIVSAQPDPPKAPTPPPAAKEGPAAAEAGAARARPPCRRRATASRHRRAATTAAATGWLVRHLPLGPRIAGCSSDRRMGRAKRNPSIFTAAGKMGFASLYPSYGATATRPGHDRSLLRRSNLQRAGAGDRRDRRQSEKIGRLA